MKKDSTHIRISASLYESIKRKAEREGRRIADVLQDLLKMLPEHGNPGTDEAKGCVLCGAETYGHRICNSCFYDPDVIRPQVFAAIYFQWAHEVAPQIGENPRDFGAFVRWINRQAADRYGVTEEEWDCWQMWLRFRKRLKDKEMTRDEPAWRKFCVESVKRNMVGYRAGSRIIGALFDFVGTRRRRASRAARDSGENSGESGATD